MPTAERPAVRGKTATAIHPHFQRLLILSGLMAFAVLAFMVHLFLSASRLEAPLVDLTKTIFATDSAQIWWYITRSAGIVAYLLLWLSTAWGLAVASKILDPLLQREFTYDFHQFLSLIAIGFIGLHLLALMFDHYQPFSLTQILIPFLSPYRPLWVAFGVVGLYLTLLVTVTFYMRKRIGMRAFRMIHILSLAAYFGVAIHSLYAGTDAPLSMVQFMYWCTFLSVVFLTAFWLVNLLLGKSARLGYNHVK